MAPQVVSCPDCHGDWIETAIAQSTQKTYSFPVTRGKRYDIILRPSVGDPDLYSRATDWPSLSQYDCRPYLDGLAEEVCTFTASGNGTHYLMVNVYSGPASWNLWVIESASGSCHVGSSGGYSHCSATCPCGYELGDCDSDAECGGGLECVTDVGPELGWPSDVGVCL